MKVKIYYHHTDCGGVVYYANYLNFLEEARTEFFAERGVSVNELAREGVLFVVSRQEIDYELPAFYGDTLDIDTRINNISGVRVEFEYEIKNQHHQVVSKAKTILVCVNSAFKPKALPEEMRRKLQ
jgi:acyl-CoA thioester hydrolase